MEDDDEIELELVDELEIAQSVNDQPAIAEKTPAKKTLKHTIISGFFCCNLVANKLLQFSCCSKLFD